MEGWRQWRLGRRKNLAQQKRKRTHLTPTGLLMEGASVPEQDRFQVITEHPAGGLIYDPSYLGIQRTNDVVFVQITLSTGRKLAQKKKLFQRMAEILAKNPGLRPQDLMINLVEVAWENWSFGNGEAQYTAG